MESKGQVIKVVFKGGPGVIKLILLINILKKNLTLISLKRKLVLRGYMENLWAAEGKLTGSLF